MNTSPKSLRFDENSFWLELNDGRVIGVPLAWFPRLLNATTEQLAKYEFSPHGIHWDSLDEDISIAGLLAGQGDILVAGLRLNLIPVGKNIPLEIFFLNTL